MKQVQLRTQQEGATLIEYGLIVALIALVCVAAVTLIGISASGLFQSIADAL